MGGFHAGKQIIECSSRFRRFAMAEGGALALDLIVDGQRLATSA
jgi:hypothetical protein